MLETGMAGSRVDHFRQRKLPDASQPLKYLMIDDVLLPSRQLNETVNRIANDLVAVAHCCSSGPVRRVARAKHFHQPMFTKGRNVFNTILSTGPKARSARLRRAGNSVTSL